MSTSFRIPKKRAAPPAAVAPVAPLVASEERIPRAEWKKKKDEERGYGPGSRARKRQVEQQAAANKRAAEQITRDKAINAAYASTLRSREEAGEK